MAIFFTADTHFGHANVITYCSRPFSSCEEMNETLMEAWAKSLRPEDTIYHLGDVVFGSKEKGRTLLEQVKKLPGKKILIPGNHDARHLDALRHVFTLAPPLHTIHVPDGKKSRVTCILCHYPLLTWEGVFHGSIQLHGHVHGIFPPTKQQADTGVDAWGFAPVRLETLLQYLAGQPDFVIPDKKDIEG